MENEPRVMREFEFEQIVAGALPEIYGPVCSISREQRLGNGRPDFIVSIAGGDRVAIVEAKAVTPSTHSRLLLTLDQLQSYAHEYAKAYRDMPQPELVLAVPGVLSKENLQFLHSHRIRVLDGPALRAAAPDLDWPTTTAGRQGRKPSATERAGRAFQEKLANTRAGAEDWSPYQKLVQDMLAFLLCPELSQPIGESSNESRVNRRDVIFPNYSFNGFWSYMRSHYRADYIVVDAKNYKGNVKKSAILQLGNYLTTHGTGLFGMVVCRKESDRSAEITRREQWILHNKLIVVLSDSDLNQMVEMKIAGQDPSELIRQKIEDFRLSM